MISSPNIARPEARDPRTDALVAQVKPIVQAPGKWPPSGTPLSVLLPFKNEEANVAECLSRLTWADQLVVVDSNSSDLTVPLAQAMGAEVYQFHYSALGWPKKRNWALESVPWKHEWVLIFDADEHMTPELAAEIEQVVTGRYPQGNGCGDGYWLNRRFFFMGRWIRHCGYYPSYNLRLFRHSLGRYERIGQLGDTGSGDNEVHEQVLLSTGEAGYLKHDFLHYAYPSLSVWVEKHNRYSSWEAHAMLAGDAGEVKASLWGPRPSRRRWLKAKTRHLPARPLLRFLYSYIFQAGFLDGYAGFVFCRLMAWYEFISLAKLYELRLTGKGAASNDNKPFRSESRR